MMETFERNIHRAVGMSDMALLLAAAFRFSEDGKLAAALADGSFLSDWVASWQDACDDAPLGDRLVERCRMAFSRAEHAALRCEHSRLFLPKGSECVVWPYESCFLHKESGVEGVPFLFRTPIALDVERQMAEAGVRFENARTEPGDSVQVECEFLAHLYAQWGEALRRGVAGEAVETPAGEWAGRIASFASDHVLKWLPSFMSRTKVSAHAEVYGGLADLGLLYLEELEEDARIFSAREAVIA